MVCSLYNPGRLSREPVRPSSIQAPMGEFTCRFVLAVMLVGASMHATANVRSGQANQLYDRATH